MHPLHEYIATQVAQKLKDRGVLVWYDPQREFAPFVRELRRGDTAPVAGVHVADVSARLVEYDGSFFELRSLVEPFACGDAPEAVVVYLPGCARDDHGSALMELEKAGALYTRPLRHVARQVLRQRYTDGVIDELLAPEKVSYEDLARAASDRSSAEPPSILKTIFDDAKGSEALLAAWLASEDRDAVIAEKESTRELVKLVRSSLGLELPQDGALAKLRALTLRYVLAGEFRSDLRGDAPASLDAVPTAPNGECRDALRGLAKRLRSSHPDAYPAMADRVEAELGLGGARLTADTLGAIDTFRFEERALLAWCGELLAAQRFDEALAVVRDREHSFWLDRDVGRRAQWESCRQMAELGSLALSVRTSVAKVGGDPGAWVAAYTARDGWHRMDGTQRRLEALVSVLDDEPEERALGVVRRLYEDTCHAMADGFTKALVKGGWTVPSSLLQTGIYGEVVADRPKPVAYFLVDAMRYEMGVELAGRLPMTAEVAVRHAIGVLPSITITGMAALLPGASASYMIDAEGGKLGARIEGVFLPDLPARKRFAAARVPELVDLALDELLNLSASKLAKRLDGARVIVVRSQEIDLLGENGVPFQARQGMDTVISNIARAIRKLAAAGVEHSAVTADHGHLFFASDRDDSMRIDAPRGDKVELHRRCWIGRGGSTPSGCVRVPATALGYASDLELVFPVGCGVFKASGDLAFHHGGPSLQELIVPVLTVRWKIAAPARTAGHLVTVTGLPEAVTNRIFSVSVTLSERQLALESAARVVRPLLVSGGRQVGSVCMAIDADFDRATGCVTLPAKKAVTVAFLVQVGDDEVAPLRVVVQDPATDAELYRSPADIPVRL